MPVYWVKADVPCGSLYWQIVIVDSTAAAVPVKFLQNEWDMRLFICLFLVVFVLLLFMLFACFLFLLFFLLFPQLQQLHV